jgi:multidrug efflux pump subunit AcrA (membrane-fusion protein)
LISGVRKEHGVRRWLIVLGLTAMVLSVTAFSTRGVLWGRRQNTKPPRLHEVKRGGVEVTVRETGTLEPLVKVEVKSKVAGRIMRFFVEEGDRVTTGQLLAQIDATEVESQVRQIEAQIAAARARERQARTQLHLEEKNHALALRDAEQSLHSASARLQQAKRQAEAQPTLTRAAIDQAEANDRAARASLAALGDTQKQERARARADLDQAQANAENAERHLKRMEALIGRGFVAQNQLDAARRDWETAAANRTATQERWDTLTEQQAAQVREARARVAQTEAALATARANAVQDAMRRDDLSAAAATASQARVAQDRARAGAEQIAARHAEVDAAEAGVKQLVDQLAEIRVRLQDTSLRSPMTGTVTRRYLEPGELVTSAIASFGSGSPVLQIARLAQMRAVCQINEVDVEKVKVGQKARIVLDAARQTSYDGHVVAVAPSAGSATADASGGGGGGQGGGAGIVKFTVKIEVDRADSRLKPGMSAAVDIVTDERKDVLTLPLEAVDMSVKPARVRVRRGDRAETVTVETGLKNDTVIEIRSGLKEGDRVERSPYRGTPRRQLDLRPRGGPAGND